MHLAKTSKMISIIYIIATAYWLLLTLATGHSAHQGGLYLQIFLFAAPLFGGLVGFRNARSWGGLKSAVGRAIIFLSLGMLTWAFGMLIWNYYIFFARVEVPYPSLADVGFALSVPLWAWGIAELSKATGVRFSLHRMGGKILFVVIPVLVTIISYYLLIEVARGGVIEWTSDGLKLFFDLFYPVGDIIILSVAVMLPILSYNFLGGLYKYSIVIICLGFGTMYFADFLFSYTTTKGTYFNGHFVDFLFVTAMSILSFALSTLDSNRSVEDERGLKNNGL